MNHVKYIASCLDLISCDEFCKELKGTTGHKKSAASPYGAGSTLTADQQRSAEEMYDAWKDAGYISANAVEWINYYPEKHFQKIYIDKLSNFLNITPKNVWVSSIMPGKTVPWHWDIEQQEDAWKLEGDLVRYTVFIDKPQIGHILLVQDDCFHMVPQGAIYQWHNWKDYHIGVNCGFGQKFVLHIVGVSWK